MEDMTKSTVVKSGQNTMKRKNIFHIPRDPLYIFKL